MKKTIFLVSMCVFAISAIAQNNILKNGGFESGNLIRSTKIPTDGVDWFWKVDNSKLPEGFIELSTENKNTGNKSLKMTLPPNEITARYHMLIAKGLGVVSKLNYTLTFWAKSNIAVKLNVYYNGFAIKDGVASKSLTIGSQSKINGNNTWAKYTVRLNGSLYDSNASWDLSQPTELYIGLTNQVISEGLELYIDDVELLD